MTSQVPQVRILQERVISTTPAPGEEQRKVAITYQLPPMPPSVIFIAEEDLPDMVWRRDHPDAGDVPEEIQKQGDAVRREAILERARTRPTAPARRI